MTNIFRAGVVKGRDRHTQLLHYTVMLEPILQIPQVFFLANYSWWLPSKKETNILDR